MAECNAMREMTYEEFQAECGSHHAGDASRKNSPGRSWRIPAELVTSLRNGSLLMLDVPGPRKPWADMSDTDSEEVDVDACKVVTELPPKASPTAKDPRSSRKITNKPLAAARVSHKQPTTRSDSSQHPSATAPVEERSEDSSSSHQDRGAPVSAAWHPSATALSKDRSEQPPSSHQDRGAPVLAAWHPSATALSKNRSEQLADSLRGPSLLQTSAAFGSATAAALLTPSPAMDPKGSSSGDLQSQRWPSSPLVSSSNGEAKAAKRGPGGRGKESKFQCQFQIGIEEECEFRVVRRIIGPAGASVKLIASETSAKLRLRGRGSKFLEGPQHQESTDALMLCVSAPNSFQLAAASRHVVEILERVYAEYDTFRAQRKLSPLGLRVQMHKGPRKGAR